jgi:hypothetical protein
MRGPAADMWGSLQIPSVDAPVVVDGLVAG